MALDQYDGFFSPMDANAAVTNNTSDDDDDDDDDDDYAFI